MLPSGWTAQVLDTERFTAFERIMATDDGLVRAHHVTAPATRSKSELYFELVAKYAGRFWAEHQAGDCAMRARKRSPDYGIVARGRLV